MILKETYTDQEKIFIDCILKQSSGQLKKEEVFRVIYGREVEFKDDLAALASMVFRINKKGELLFKSKKGSFILVLDQKKTA